MCNTVTESAIELQEDLRWSAITRHSSAFEGGPNNGMTIPVSGSALVMGRGADNDIDVDESTVSRRHAVIIITPSGFILRDLGSANGTYLGSEEIGHREHHLRHGDRIRLAGSEATFTFRYKEMGTVKMGMQQPDNVAEPDDRLGEKESELLRLLESEKGAPVAREEIASRIWPEVPSDEVRSKQLIDRTVLRLRAHLHDDPRRPKRLITVGDHGYLLM